MHTKCTSMTMISYLAQVSCLLVFKGNTGSIEFIVNTVLVGFNLHNPGFSDSAVAIITYYKQNCVSQIKTKTILETHTYASSYLH